MLFRSGVMQPLLEEPGWPRTEGARPVFLLDAHSGLEARLLAAWIDRSRPGQEEAKPAALRLAADGSADPTQLETELASGDDPLFVPLRIVWLAPMREGRRRANLFDLLTLGDPRDPGRIRQSIIWRRSPDRCRVAIGTPARASELRARWREAGGADIGQTTGLVAFVARQATLALERAERGLRGSRYKVPRLVHPEVLGRPVFRAGLAELARQEERPERELAQRAASYLREIAATHSRLVIDVVAQLIHALYRQGYRDTIQYDHEQLTGLAPVMQRNPVVFLPSHKSNLDHLVLQYVLHENGLPPNHTAGGINMNFFPVGQLVRRSGVFFIRRSFRENNLYKHVLRSYIDYLIEKRFTLEWYLEGGRSRSGKLLPPRYGMLAYVVDSYRRGKSEDVILLPVSIAYDQIADVGSYTTEQQGGAKERESLRWFIRFIRGLRRHYGSIHIRFGEPVSLRAQLGAPDPALPPDPDERNLELQKVAFAVCDRINRVTPITPISLVTLALLGVGDRAVTAEETREALRELLIYAHRRKLPVTTEVFGLEKVEGVQKTLEALEENDVVARFDGGRDTIYRIGSDEQLAAAYYRNTIVHFFLNAAIVELALVRAASAPDAEADLWSEAMRVRDLLKFEFFFADKSKFREELRDELSLGDPNWESTIHDGNGATHELLRERRPLVSHLILRPFLESYRVVADVLAQHSPNDTVDSDALVSECIGLGRQYQLQHRIHSSDSISKELFQTALRLADNRGLIERESENGSTDLGARRQGFASEIRDMISRVETIDALAAGRRAGLLE